jgi:hypothetical protein
LRRRRQRSAVIGKLDAGVEALNVSGSVKVTIEPGK